MNQRGALRKCLNHFLLIFAWFDRDGFKMRRRGWQIELIRPKVIVMLGAVPLRLLFPEVRAGITRIRGNWMDYHGIKVMPTFHPAYLLRNPAAKADVWKDLQLVMAVFGKKHVPGRRA